jgi:hypothetical protein
MDVAGASLPGLDAHSRALQAATSGWNRTRSVLLLGLKARRDFHVYDWPFRQHGFKVP